MLKIRQPRKKNSWETDLIVKVSGKDLGGGSTIPEYFMLGKILRSTFSEVVGSSQSLACESPNAVDIHALLASSRAAVPSVPTHARPFSCRDWVSSQTRVPRDEVVMVWRSNVSWCPSVGSDCSVVPWQWTVLWRTGRLRRGFRPFGYGNPVVAVQKEQSDEWHS